MYRGVHDIPQLLYPDYNWFLFLLFVSILLLNDGAKRNRFPYLKIMTTFLNRLLWFAWKSGLFSLPFDSVAIGSYDAWKSGLFSLPFDSLTIESYDAWKSGLFSLPFDSPLTIQSYDAWKSGLFSLPFDSLTIESYDAWKSGLSPTFWFTYYRVIWCMKIWTFTYLLIQSTTSSCYNTGLICVKIWTFCLTFDSKY